ncbi:MAG: radical SAM protein [Oligoflexia bacterium]|nr:radical SAM protein [Oligoflexia bacterium]
MGSGEVLVTEIFHSIQGESSLAGLPFAFIRLTGCNLRCAYCDSAYAFHGGRKMTIPEVLEAVRPFGARNVLLTGGEPLLQREAPALVEALVAQGYAVSIETHGEVSIARVVASARIIMDIKTPGSGMCRGGFEENLPLLKESDEIKFVLAAPEDYPWARDLVRSGRLRPKEILFSAAQSARGAPGAYPGVELAWLAERILEDRLPVRLQYQLHKLIWGPDRKGV